MLGWHSKKNNGVRSGWVQVRTSLTFSKRLSLHCVYHKFNDVKFLPSIFLQAWQASKQAGSLLKENDNNFMNRGCLLLVSSLFYSTGHIKGGRAQEPQTFWVSVALVVTFQGAEVIPCGPSMMDPLKTRRVVFFRNDQISCFSSPKLSF